MDSNGTPMYTMPVMPAGYGNGFGGDFGSSGWWIILLFLFAGGGFGWGNGFIISTLLSLIIYFFEGNERSTMIGLQGSINGLGSAVCEVAAEMGKGIVKRIGIQDQFGESAPYERLLAKNGITVENIVATAEALQ